MKYSSGEKSKEDCKLPEYHAKDLLFDLLKGKDDIISQEITGLIKAEGKPAKIIVRYHKDKLKYHIIITPVQDQAN